MLTVVAFVVALAILIAIHEYGHYRVAVACGVKVLRFSIGFGKTIWRRQPPGSPTEFAIGMLPLGGYVKMLDEREGPVAPEERHLAFNNRPLRHRAAIVAAGPLANLLLAVLLYACVNWIGVDEPRALLAQPVAGSLAEQAGLRAGDEVLAGSFDDAAPTPLRSFEDLRWLITRGALEGHDLRLEVAASGQSEKRRELVLPLAELHATDATPSLFRQIGILAPWTPALIGEVQAGGSAAAAGLRKGDIVLSVAGHEVGDGLQLRERIRETGAAHAPATAPWRILRDGAQQTLEVTPAYAHEGDKTIGRIGAFVGGEPQMRTVRYGFLDGLLSGVAKTWNVSTLTLRMMGRMVIGEASLRNLSGPLTIAEYAGKSASLGFTQYLVFLALISVSLGVLNLLPLPVLDGGHLVMYAWEGVSGRAISQRWLERLQRGGVAVLVLMMSIALFNDLSRLLS